MFVVVSDDDDAVVEDKVVDVSNDDISGDRAFDI